MPYQLTFSTKAEKDIAKLKKTDQPAFKKLTQLLVEIMEHPYTGTGKPEQLKYNMKGHWSRRISHKHRLVYEVIDHTVTVKVESAFSHYGDK
ncbi:Txe/YoeB family addiction module toxin [Parapedobacter sp. GCM10030251]|uniref:Txe/YoeB family addiction module toxin n=1 Tax=Parapedobacter sp. GCM10030251 TaxID=3273419 RepID=UPI00360DC926